MSCSTGVLVLQVTIMRRISEPSNILASFDWGRDGLLECHSSMLANYELENMRNTDTIEIDLSSALVVSKTVGLNDRFVFTLAWRKLLLKTNLAKD